MTIAEGVIAAIAVLTFLGTLLVQRSSAGKIEGTMAKSLENHGERINKIEDEQVRQWQSIGQHGEKIAALEAIRKTH